MVKDTIIKEKNCFSDDSARRFMQTIQQTSCNISNPDLSLHSSPSRPKALCLSGFREVKSFLYLFTHSSPLFTHIGFNWFPVILVIICPSRKKTSGKAWRFGKIIVNLQMETKD